MKLLPASRSMLVMYGTCFSVGTLVGAEVIDVVGTLLLENAVGIVDGIVDGSEDGHFDDSVDG
jgi:hypothetical protein